MSLLNKKELKLIFDLMNTLGTPVKKISIEDKENLESAITMQEAGRTKRVSEKTIIKKTRC
ncbi:MAG: hypothetical protein OJF59_000256 [Cytophagales bacterium]|nr:MAG: hypothetical protein OJF59_000256 [Cytophagales bacterium]